MVSRKLTSKSLSDGPEARLRESTHTTAVMMVFTLMGIFVYTNVATASAGVVCLYLRFHLHLSVRVVGVGCWEHSQQNLQQSSHGRR